eukprot:jgi/Bigna1/147180/aug1.131_g21888
MSYRQGKKKNKKKKKKNKKKKTEAAVASANQWLLPFRPAVGLVQVKQRRRRKKKKKKKKKKNGGRNFKSQYHSITKIHSYKEETIPCTIMPAMATMQITPTSLMKSCGFRYYKTATKLKPMSISQLKFPSFPLNINR